MVKDATGREGLSAGALAKELSVSPAEIKKALTTLEVSQADFVKAGCGYYFADRLPAIKAALK
jgi:DNA-binding transcriptional regulator YhcF (GntR family)